MMEALKLPASPSGRHVPSPPSLWLASVSASSSPAATTSPRMTIALRGKHRRRGGPPALGIGAPLRRRSPPVPSSVDWFPVRLGPFAVSRSYPLLASRPSRRVKRRRRRARSRVLHCRRRGEDLLEPPMRLASQAASLALLAPASAFSSWCPASRASPGSPRVRRRSDRPSLLLLFLRLPSRRERWVSKITITMTYSPWMPAPPPRSPSFTR